MTQILTGMLCCCLLTLHADAEGKPPKPVFAAHVNGHSIEVYFTYGHFDPKKRKVEVRLSRHDSGKTFEEVLIQGKPVLGTDNRDPAKGHGVGDRYEVIEAITVI